MENQKISYKYLKDFFNKKNYKISKANHFDIAKILSSGGIVSVARECEEFGARALGNRSILADPSRDGVIKEINEMIKNRDFWMPFALTIMKKHHKKYIFNNKNIDSSFMTIGFDTIPLKYNEIKNGTHPYDNTVRPQILTEEQNADFYNIINEFFKLKGIPALLNTSLNLHGMPISSTFKDVSKTFINSSLKNLFLNDTYLIQKK